MEQKSNESLLVIESKTAAVRVLIVAIAVGAIVFAWFTVKWQLAFMLADQSSISEPNAKAIGQFAVDLAPSDPHANWYLLNSERSDFTSESLNASVSGMENIVRLAPYNYNWWVELGRMYEQAGKRDSAEAAFKHAVELAPNYTIPRWQLGNFYLRSGDDQKAFAELQRAAELNSVYREQVFSIAWDYFDKDMSRLETIAGDSPAVRAGLAKFYAVREEPDASLRMWNSLTPQEKEANSDVAKVIAQGLFEKRFYREAVEFVRDLGIEPNARKAEVQNGGFEAPIGELDYTYFNWRITKIDKIDIKLDPTQKHEGNRSLRINFDTFSGGLFYEAYQTIAVDPSTQYILSFWVKTDDLKSGGMPTLEVLNANTDKLITSSETFPIGTNNWQQLKVEFTTPEDAKGIVIRTSRSYCGEHCPIVGTFWYDDFKLERVKG
ncbi:MAG: tetratricopeptide repeat protein [Pyrinomonadaceae bacterium]|nr:tetratricopeptide repeat protein [Pyrinomonadaceae bacterium]